MTEGTKISGRFGPGNPGKPVGAVSKTTKSLKEAILLAAESVGKDGKGLRGLTGYLEMLAQNEPASFCSLLGKVLPLTIAGAGANGEHVIVRVERVVIDANKAEQG